MLIALAALAPLIFWLARSRSPRGARSAVWFGGVIVTAWIAFGMFASLPRFGRVFPRTWWFYWARGTALALALAALGAFLIWLLWRRLPAFSSDRRGFLRAAGGAAVGLPFAAVGFGIFVQRLDLRTRETDLTIPDLPADLDGLRIVQLSDIHLSPYLSEQDLARAVAIANETRAHVAVITGDLITSRHDPLDACLRQLARLRAEAGILGCHGNHEIYAGAEEYATREGNRLGIRFLRQQALRLRFGNATINFAGVDYQRTGRPYLRGAGKLLAPGTLNVLLSHNPDVFPTAARLGFDCTLSGHTHGGQVTVEILNQSLNVARFWTPYVYGLYRQGPASIYVTRGIGTVGIPARIGAPPEIALIRLRRGNALAATQS